MTSTVPLPTALSTSPGEGKSFVIDLNRKNADKLRNAIEPFVWPQRGQMGAVQAPAPRCRLSSSSSSGRGARAQAWVPLPVLSGVGRGRTVSRFPTVAA